MLLHHTKVLASAIGWVLAVTLMATSETGKERGWALIVTGAAMTPTLWLIFDYNRNRLRDEFLAALQDERTRSEQLIQAVAVQFARAEVPRLHSSV